MGLRKRAVNDAQKNERRETILRAALQSFNEGSYDAVKIESVAKQAGIAKGTVYLYFRTKEELFLALNERAWIEWFTELNRRLRKEHYPTSIPRIVGLFADTLAERPEFLRLIAILHTTLEQNVPADTWLAFKRTLRDGMLESGKLLEQKLDFLKDGEGAVLFVRIQALIIGLQHLASPPANAADALEEHELSLFRVDLAGALRETLTVLFMGLKARGKAPGR